jgi:four helix bundle protein
LSLQIRKAAVSIPSNTAEGYQRRATRAYLNHLSIASGSQGELHTQLEVARRLGFITAAEAATVLEAAAEVGRLLYGLIESVKKDEPGQREYSFIVPDD